MLKNQSSFDSSSLMGSKASYLNPAVIDVEELEDVASVTCKSSVSSSEVVRKFSSATSLEDEATCSSTRQTLQWRPPSSAGHRRPRCPQRLLCEILHGSPSEACETGASNLRFLGRIPRDQSTSLSPRASHQGSSSLRVVLQSVVVSSLSLAALDTSRATTGVGARCLRCTSLLGLSTRVVGTASHPPLQARFWPHTGRVIRQTQPRPADGPTRASGHC